MPTYEIRAPNGRTYRIDGPDGATDAQVRAEVLRQHPDAGGQSRPKPRSTMQALGDATVNTLAGLAQGLGGVLDVTTDAIAGGLRMAAKPVAGAASALSDAAGMPGASRSIRGGAETFDRAMARPFTIGGAIERAAPTPEDGAGKTVRVLSQLTGGLVSPANRLLPATRAAPPRLPPRATPPAPNAARRVVDEARNVGVRVMTSDVRPPRTMMGKAARAVGERIPIVGTGGPRQAQQAERVQAVKTLLSDFGAVETGAADDVAASLLRKRGKQLGKLSAAKDSVIDGIQGTVAVPKSIRAINNEIGRLTKANAEAFAPVIEKLRSFKAALTSGKTLREIEVNRRLLGDMFADPSLAAIKGEGQKSINAIYAPLRDDMGAFILTNGGKSAHVKWQGANNQLAAMAGELNVGAFKNVLKTADATPENVGSLLFSSKPSDVRRLVSNLDAPGRAKAQAAVLHKAMEKAGGIDNLSPDRFVNEIERLGKSVGVVFQNGDMARVEGLSRVLNATRRAGQAGVLNENGQQVVPFLIGGAAIQQPVLAIGSGLAARIYESAAVRDLLLKLGRTKPGSPQEAMMLPRVMSAISTQAERLAPAMNDNVRLPAAASGGEPEQQEQQQPF